MEAVKQWILAIAVFAVIIEILDILMPESSTRKTAFIICGLVLSFSIIVPVTSIYDNLQLVDFNYESARENFVSNRDAYTEEQAVKLTTDYKDKLKNHVEGIVGGIKSVSDCSAEVVIEEDYNSAEFGMVYRIYVTASGKPTATEKKRGSGFGDVGRIEQVEIDIDGIKIKERETPPAEAEDVHVQEVREAICKEFKLDGENVFVSIK